MSTNERWMNWLFSHPLFFVLYFIVLWALVSYVIGLLSGWIALSRRFRVTGAFLFISVAFSKCSNENYLGDLRQLCELRGG